MSDKGIDLEKLATRLQVDLTNKWPSMDMQ